jgi:hypothetical protein
MERRQDRKGQDARDRKLMHKDGPFPKRHRSRDVGLREKWGQKRGTGTPLPSNREAERG